MKRRSKDRRQGGKGTDDRGMDEAFTDTKEPPSQQAPKVRSAVTPALGNTHAVPLNGPASPSSAPSTETESDKPSGGILSKKKHRHRRRHRDKKSTDKLAGPNRKLSSEVATTQPSHTATGPMGSVVSVDAPVIQAPQTSPAPTGPADLQQGPFVAQPQMFTQIQQPMEFQPHMAQYPPDVHWQHYQQQQEQLMQLPQQPAQPPLIPPVGFLEPMPLQTAPTIRPPAANTTYAAAEAPRVDGASTTGSLSNVSYASDPTSSTSFVKQPTAGFQSSLQQTPVITMPPVLAGEQSQLQGSSTQQGASTLTAGGNLVASATTPTSFIDHASHAKVADRRKGEREFDRQVGENVLDNQGVHNAQRDDVGKDIGPFRRARAGSVTRLNRKSKTWKQQNRASVSHQQEETPSFNTDGSTQSFDPAISLVSEPVPTTAVIINAEMAQRLITALQKCEGQPPKDATPDVSEAAHVKLRGRESDEKLKATEAEGFTETLRSRRTSADRLGSSEEFYEVIAEEVIEPDKNTEGGQRKRIVRKTTRSRKHDVIEEPWEDGSTESTAIPTLPRWENIQPSTSRGAGRVHPPAHSARDVDDTGEENAAPFTGASRVRSASGRRSHAKDDRYRTAAPTSTEIPSARRDERRPPKRLPARRYPPPPFYGSPGPLPYDQSLTRQSFQLATPAQYPNYPGPSWLQSWPDHYEYYPQYYDASTPYMNPNIVEMAQHNAIPIVHQSYPEQLSQRYLPSAYGATRVGSQRFESSQREMTRGRPGGTRSRNVANDRCGRPYQPYSEGTVGAEAQVGGSHLCPQAAASITPHISRGPGSQGTSKQQPQKNYALPGPNHPRRCSNSNEFRAAVTPWPQESFCWQREVPASKSSVPRAPSCRDRDSAATATTRPASAGHCPARSRPSAVHQTQVSAPSTRKYTQRAQSAGPSCARVAPCGCRCHEGRATSARGGVTLEELLRREDDIRRDEQLRQLSQRLEDERIRHDAKLAARTELLDELQRNADTGSDA
ncbi:hypothetical protein HPB51_014098 [Rhipicephalus microplus]|uniref:Uncharacterized protein n=1 Tax=Rhipicephalus microplus TaxID=6941 RepID=A0A9J6DUP3_RHIMP|nr:hypothetical protein HPB51_014098 [Rhipicephalus microplus]